MNLGTLVFWPILLPVSAQSAPADQVKPTAKEIEARARALVLRTGRFLQGGQVAETKGARRQHDALEADIKKLREDAAAAGVPLPLNMKIGEMWFGGGTQYQYRDTTAIGGSDEAVRARRVRLNINYLIDYKTMSRVSNEFASGFNQTTSQVRDAYVQYRPESFLSFGGPAFTVGQMNTPLGYEITYSSWNRTWPERSRYNQAFFNGERGRGAMVQFGDVQNYVYFGMFNPLSVNDIEQVNVPPNGDLGPIGGARFQSGDFNGGVSGFLSDRPAYTTNGVTAPRGKREFGYIDLRYAPLNSKLEIRTEAMIGHDRVPKVNAVATNVTRPVSGAHINFDYQLNPKFIAVARWETFNVDRSAPDRNLSLFGFALVHDVSDQFRLSTAYEWVHDESRKAIGQERYNQLTVRAQVRF